MQLLVHDLEQFPDGFPWLAVCTRRVTLGHHSSEPQPLTLCAPPLLPRTLVFAVPVDVGTAPSRCLFAPSFQPAGSAACPLSIADAPIRCEPLPALRAATPLRHSDARRRTIAKAWNLGLGRGVGTPLHMARIRFARLHAPLATSPPRGEHRARDHTAGCGGGPEARLRHPAKTVDQ
jgi:hypothetical protein